MALIQQFHEWRVCEAVIAEVAQGNNDDVDPGTKERRQMIAPVSRWAVHAERQSRSSSETQIECVTVHGKEHTSTEPEEREQMRHEGCWMSSVQERETRHRTTDVSDKEDAAKVAPDMEQVAHTLRPL